MCEKEEKYIYWLLSIPGIGAKKAEKIIAWSGSVEAFFKGGNTLLNQVDFISQKDKEAIRLGLKQNVEEEFQKLTEKKIQFLPISNVNYPERLRKIPDPPYALYVKGTVPKEERPCVAVIGARDCSAYGLYVAKELGVRLAEEGIQVVSGLARGIDSEGQRAAVLAGGSVYAVLGCGVDICYPKENWKLYERLTTKGGILSEYAPGTEPKASLFPKRNRIISGLADVVVVVEAKEKSGTLITVDMALEQGKEVYVIPGRVTDPMSAGCNRLIRQGAGILQRPEEFMEEVWMIWKRKRNVLNAKSSGKVEPFLRNETTNIQSKSTKSVVRSTGLGKTADKIVELLDLHPQTMQQLYSNLLMEQEVSIAELSELLFNMENLCILHKKEMVYFLNLKKI